MKRNTLILAFVLVACTLWGQEFVQYTLLPNGPFRGSVKPLDIDGDGNMDYVSFGANNLGGGAEARIEKNGGIVFDKDWVQMSGWEDQTAKSFVPFGIPGSVWWAQVLTHDFSNKNLPGLFIQSGENNMSAPFYNEGDFKMLWRYSDLSLDAEELVGQAAVGDFDNDGIQDIALIGGMFKSGEGNPGLGYQRTAIYWGKGTINGFEGSSVGGAEFAKDATFDVPNDEFMDRVEVKSVDVNNDGWLDIWVAGSDNCFVCGRQFFSYFMMNNGDRTFTATASSDLGIAPRGNSSTDFADIDGDGWIDMIVMGDGGGDDFKVRVYRNGGNGSFFEMTSDIMFYPRSVGGGVRLVDIDNDGDMDVVIQGDHLGFGSKTRLFLNNNNVFELSSAFDGLLAYNEGWLDFADFDNDGRLDMIQVGLNQLFPQEVDGNPALLTAQSTITQNLFQVNPNTAPTVPANLKMTVSGKQYSFSWDKATDAETPAAALTYNIYVKEKSTGKFLVSPLADLNNGNRFVTERGNAGFLNSVSYTLNTEDEIEWGVQAIDNQYKGSMFASSFGQSTGIDIVNNSNQVVTYVKNDHLIIVGISKAQISIYSVDGKQLVSERYEGTPISLSNLKSGIYLVKIDSVQDSTVVKISK